MSNAVIFNGDYVKALKSKLKLGESANIETGSQDPSTLSLSSPVGSIYLRTNGLLYVKYSSAPSAWAPTLVTGTGSTLTNTFLQDSTVGFVDYSDATKKMYFELSQITTGQTTTITIPDTSGVMVLGVGATGRVSYWNTANTLASEAQLSPLRGGTGSLNLGVLSYGDNNLTFSTSGATSLTLPTFGTVATLAGTENLSNKTINASSIGSTTPSSGAFTFLSIKGGGVGGTAYLDLLDDTVAPSSPSPGYERFYLNNSVLYLKDNTNNVSTLATLQANQTFTGNNIFAVNSSDDAFKISQSGTGNAFVVEDEASPDTSPFVIKSDGKVIIGHTENVLVGSSSNPKPLQIIGNSFQTTGLSSISFGNAGYPSIILGRSKGASIGDFTAVSANDQLGEIVFAGSDGTDCSSQSAKIDAIVNGLVADNSVPAKIVFSTTGEGETTPQNRFSVSSGSVSINGTTAQGGELRFNEITTNGTNYVGFKAPNSIAADVSWTLPSADGLDGQTLTTDGAGTLSWSSAGNTIAVVNQTSHGFTTADVGRPLYLNGSTYVFARADAANTAEVVGLIYSIVNTNTFQMCLVGDVTSVGSNVIEGGGALVAGETYFLSSTSAGQITTTDTSVIGEISKPIGVARSSSVLNFFNMRGSVVGGANARTQIALVNNNITTIQSVSEYLAGELAGWVYINGTTDYRFYLQSQFARNGANTDYNISFQTMGDVPPFGFAVTVTAAGLIQITLPDIPGFVSADVNFALNAPAVGSSFPLSVPGSSVLSNYKTVSGAYTILPSDYYVSASGSSAYSISLPPANSVSGKIFIVKSRLAAGQLLTIDAYNSETIDGSLTINLFQNESCFLVSNGTSWEMF